MKDVLNPEPLLERAWELRHEGETDAAAQALDKVEEQADRQDDHATTVRTMIRQGHLAQDEGNLTQAIDLAHQALALYDDESLDDKELLVYAQRHLADFQRRAGLRDEALESYEAALATYRELGDSYSLDFANALRGIALALEEAGEQERANDAWNAAGNIYTRLEIADGIAECAMHLRQDH